MRINIKHYDINKKYIQTWVKDQKYLSPRDCVSILACALQVPCVVVCFYIGEVTEWPKEIMDAIRVFIQFYGYTRIENIPDSYPGERIGI